MQLDQIVIYVSDMGRSLPFYRDLLAVPPAYESPGWVTFPMGSTLVCIHDGRMLRGGHPHANSVAVFRVPQIRTTVRKLKDKGIVFRFENHAGGNGDLYSAFVDPDGNELMLVGRPDDT